MLQILHVLASIKLLKLLNETLLLNSYALTERSGREVNTPASCSGGPEFSSQPSSGLS